MSCKTRVLLAGAGFMGKAHTSAYANVDDAEIVGIVDPFEAGKELAAELSVPCFGSVPEALKEIAIDMVDVCVPTFLHEQYVVEAIDAGKPVLCEKPFALSSESARRMRDVARDKGVPLMVAQTLRFWPEYKVVAESWKNGSLGDAIMTTAYRLSQPPAWAKWYGDPTLSGGGALDLHAHDIDFLVSLHGTVTDVYSVGWKNDDGCWNHVVTNLSFASGQRAVAEGALQMSDGWPFTMGLRMVGDKGTISYEFSAGANLDEVTEHSPTLHRYMNGSDPEVVEFEAGDAYTAEIAYFVNCLREGKSTEIVPIDESVHVLDVLMAVQRSLESGRIEKP